MPVAAVASVAPVAVLVVDVCVRLRARMCVCVCVTAAAAAAVVLWGQDVFGAKAKGGFRQCIDLAPRFSAAG